MIETEKLKASQDVYVSVKDTISETVEFSESIEFLIEKTETFCKERAIYNALRDAVLIADGQDKNKSADAIPAILQSALNVCFDSSVGHDYYLDYEHRYDYYHRKDAKVPTGSSTFDSITRGGWSRKTLNVLLAPPHGGKSFLMVNFARGAVEAGFNVLYITLEMAEEEIKAAKADIAELDEALQLMLIPKDEDDSASAMLEVRGGTGGEVELLQDENVAVPTAESGASFVLEQNGQRHAVSSLLGVHASSTAASMLTRFRGVQVCCARDTELVLVLYIYICVVQMAFNKTRQNQKDVSKKQM